MPTGPLSKKRRGGAGDGQARTGRQGIAPLALSYAPVSAAVTAGRYLL